MNKLEDIKQQKKQAQESEQKLIETFNMKLIDSVNNKEFELYKRVIAKVGECYKNGDSLQGAQDCADQIFSRFKEYKKLSGQQLELHHNSLQDCTIDCQNNLEMNIIECYGRCFDRVEQLVQDNY